MFKKKLQKRENILNEFENNINNNINDINNKNDNEKNSIEPKIFKKTKINPELIYSVYKLNFNSINLIKSFEQTKETTHDYHKATNEYIDQIMFKARSGLVKFSYFRNLTMNTNRYLQDEKMPLQQVKLIQTYHRMQKPYH